MFLNENQPNTNLSFNLTDDANASTHDVAPHIMRVKKRDGSLEPVDVTKIVERVSRLCQGLSQVDPLRVATKAISGLYDGAATKELDNLSLPLHY